MKSRGVARALELQHVPTTQLIINPTPILSNLRDTNTVLTRLGQLEVIIGHKETASPSRVKKGRKGTILLTTAPSVITQATVNLATRGHTHRASMDHVHKAHLTATDLVTITTVPTNTRMAKLALTGIMMANLRKIAHKVSTVVQGHRVVITTGPTLAQVGLSNAHSVLIRTECL